MELFLLSPTLVLAVTDISCCDLVLRLLMYAILLLLDTINFVFPA